MVLAQAKGETAEEGITAPFIVVVLGFVAFEWTP
jgi:hypothetical protein